MSETRRMPETVTLTIDGKTITTKWGTTILQAARENGIYIPTMCYLSKVEPIGSCRMCVVEVDGVDGMILSCQEKAVDGAVIRTNSDELFAERQKIMKLYDVNHPLECGVCDKSGECDLQNKTLEFRVDRQDFSARDQHRPVKNWGFISYDPSLCIMCEKCVRTCAEIIGDDALAIETGGYKSTIVNTRDLDDCAQCGECMAVCPVGALVSTDFKYTSNAWELDYVPASCAHCSAGCQLYYNVKHSSIENPEPKIYRVTNDFEFSTLCGAGRFGYDFENRGATRNPETLAKAAEAFRKAETIRFASVLSNEEALLLSRIAEKTGAKLVCDEARGFQKFLRAYRGMSGRSLPTADLEAVRRSRVILTLGTRLYDDAPMVKFAVATASRREKAQMIYCHPIEDPRLQKQVTQFVKYEAGSEEGVAALLAATLIDRTQAPEELRKYLDGLDIGYLSAESNVSEEELDRLKLTLWKRKRFTLIVGEDLYNHPRVENIARLLAAIERYSDFELLVIPPASNTLGIASICDLADEATGYTVGVNTPGDYVLSALGDGECDLPAMNQQEGTLVNLEGRVVPTHPALPYGGWELADIARTLGMPIREIIDLTPELPTEAGFDAVEFDALPDYFDAAGVEHRGYRLARTQSEPTAVVPDEPEELESYDGTVLYRCNPDRQFSPFTAKTHQLAQEPVLRGSAQFAMAAKLRDGDRVRFTQDGIRFERVFSIDTTLKGTVAINPVFDIGLSGFALSSYRFSPVKIEKAGEADE
ncbi:2Fe-2S iron-sulfur cluster-binding protein [Nitratifractor sp.]|uniref:2Fe-2S iron-sulfur cluster-binding protein n=1 Tax=Nitratifractor sp. TaxID=2268144 RepID=UPI0025D145C4|nr:2Fe-2S iron-sulfur cluster-binding protein [Nitratifractor sp.]